MKATKRGARKVQPIGQAEALQILESAINYCRQAGLEVRAGNVNGALALTIGGAALAHAGAVCAHGDRPGAGCGLMGKCYERNPKDLTGGIAIPDSAGRVGG